MTKKKNTRTFIYVYADWKGIESSKLMGVLTIDVVRGEEVFSFEYDNNWLTENNCQQLDPDLQMYKGPQYLSNEKLNFGLFLDSCPDRWGRVLMDRREAILAKEEQRAERKLYEKDYLLGVYDGNRMGALRFKLEPEGKFLNSNTYLATPPWAKLRELEFASLKLEEDGIENTKEYLKWLNLLISPGSSLGGARPKASIVDESNDLWIAKFPSRKDDIDIGGWEMVAYKIAIDAGVSMANCMIQKFNSAHHTFMTKRFDREGIDTRIHFSSAMTCLGKVDGNDGSEGVSYLDIAEFIVINGSNVDYDLEELWRRMVLSVCITNVDDHLRNHGFMLGPKGWTLSPAYDINPVRNGEGLKLNITQTDNSQDLKTLLSVIEYFRIDPKKAEEIIAHVAGAAKKWRNYASEIGIPSRQQTTMERAFRVADAYQLKS